MYIAICDDDPQALEQIAHAVGAYAASCGEQLRVQTFADAESLLQAARAERFTHYFLDVMMPEMDGISAAREIRSFDADARLVFLSSFTEYAYQSYRVRATDYLLKPVEPQLLAGLLDRLRAEEENTQAYILIENGRGVMRIPYDRLSFVEVSQKKLHFHLTDGQLREVAGSLKEYEELLLARPEFMRVGRYYIVNILQVQELSPAGISTFSGKNIPIPRRLYPQIQKDYMQLLFAVREE